MLFHLSLMTFCLLICLSLKTLMFMIKTGKPVLVELIDLANYVIIFLSQMTLLSWLTCLLTSLTVTLTVLLFWIYFFLLMVVFVLQWLFLHWEILIVLSQGMPISLHSLRLFLCWLGGSFEGCSMGGYL